MLCLDVSEERRDPSGDVGSAGAIPVFVDRTPELLVGCDPGGGLDDDRQQVCEIAGQAIELAGELVRPEVQRPPVRGNSFQPDFRVPVSSPDARACPSRADGR
jgi:hypothetical protein